MATIPYPKRWAALFLLCMAQFLVIMDTSIIGVALPAIQTALGYEPSGLQWIFNAYVIFFGGLLLLGGKLSDLYGPRKLFVTGFVILTLSSLGAGLAWDPASLNIARALQGLGSALIAPAALTLLMSTFQDPAELNKALGFWGAAAAAGGSAGVFLGGVITEYISWRWVFLINIPIGIIVILLTSSYLIKGFTQKGKIDFLGAALITASMMSLVIGIISIEANIWAALSWITAGIILLVLFILVQRQSKNPLIPLSIFKRPNLSNGNIVMMLMAGAWIPLWFFLNLYLQNMLGLSAFYSGLALLPMTLAIMLFMVVITGKLVARFGFKAMLVTGMILLVVALLWFALLPLEGNFWIHVLIPSLIAAAGMSFAYIPGTIASMSGAQPEETGTASGLVNTSYQIGSAIGLAIVVAIATTVTKGDMAGGAIEKVALHSGYSYAFIAALVIATLGALLSLIGIRSKTS